MSSASDCMAILGVVGGNVSVSNFWVHWHDFCFGESGGFDCGDGGVG